MSETTEVTIVVDIDGEPDESLMTLFKGIVDMINEKAPNLAARLEVWEPVSDEDLAPKVPEVSIMDLVKGKVSEAFRQN